MYQIWELCTDDGLTDAGWSECERVCKTAVYRYYAGPDMYDIYGDALCDTAIFLRRVYDNIKCGKSEHPRDIGGVLFCYARNAASNANYRYVYKRDRIISMYMDLKPSIMQSHLTACAI